MTTANDNKKNTLQFIEYHQPNLPSGDYTLTVTQTIETTTQSIETTTQSIETTTQSIETTTPKIPAQSFSATLNFSVRGPRFALDPQEIQSVFPPAGSLGDHSNVLPHIILNRSTLPWERNLMNGNSNSQNLPWLALLLFEDGELPKEPSQNGSTEKENLKSISLKELKNTTTEKIKWPGISYEIGEKDEDRASVIDVRWGTLKKIIPTREDLKYLTHVRTTEKTDDTQENDELAVIICNRLPTSEKMNTVHLVSLEGRYKTDNKKVVFDNQDAEDIDSIRLVSLKSWRFACTDDKQSFKGLLMHLNHHLLFNIQDQDDKISAALNISALNKEEIPDDLSAAFNQYKHSLNKPSVVEFSQWRITDKNQIYLISNSWKVYNQAGRFLFKLSDSSRPPQINPQINNDLRNNFENNQHKLSEKATLKELNSNCWWINTQYFITLQNKTLYVYYLDPDSSSTLRLPPIKTNDESLNDVVEQYLKMGCLPLPHAMHQGNKTVSWYRSPLVPGKNETTEITLPVHSADNLILYNSTYGMFDVSYAAAWELGRLLALQSKSFSVSLYNWKRIHIQNQKDAKQQLDHLPFDSPSHSSDFPSTVSNWFEKLAVLEGVPFNYLVPDERLLPLESIRFFQIDKMWMECLFDGAFSIGRVSARHLDMDKELLKKKFAHQDISGFLIRSDVVSGWPNLLADGYNNQNPANPLKLVRTAMLSKNILICLFEEVIDRLDLHLKPEALHFGLDFSEENTQDFFKKLRTTEGKESDNTIEEIPWKTKDKRVIDISQLAGKISKSSENQPFTSAQFAVQIIEGVEKVSFNIRK